MKSFLLFFCYFLFVNVLFSQNNNKGEGRLLGILIEDKTGVPLPYASVILKSDNGEIIEGVITEESGKFLIENIPMGDYMLEISYLGFETYSNRTSFKDVSNEINLGSIRLKEDETQLNEVLIKSEISQISLKLDKKVFRVGKDILSQSGSVIDVLGNVPSVSVDPSGTVSLRNNTNVTILINGRRSGLTSRDALEQIPSDNVETVEVITNPSARYDASGSAGIINIILKKNKTSGFSGQVRLVTGIPTDFRVNASANYKTNKLNLFSNIGLRYTDYIGLYTYDQSSLRNDKPIFISQREDEDRHDDGLSIYLGADYYINEKNSLTLAFLRNDTKDTDETNLTYDLFSNDLVDSTLVTNGKSEMIRNYNQLEVNYTKTFKKEKNKFTIDFQYDVWDSEKDFDIATSRTFPDSRNLSQIRTIETNRNNDFVVQSDLVTFTGKDSKLELGIKYETRLIKNGFRAEELTNNEFQILDDINNDLDYDEEIVAAYTQYGGKINKLSYLIGLRFEGTKIKIEDLLGSFNQDFSYENLFPTLNLSYSFSEKTQIQGSYSKRIDRPFLRQLNPFAELLDFNTRFSGNPNLDPAFTDALEFAFLSKIGSITINPSIYYSDTKDNIQIFTQQDENDIFLATLINLDREKRYGMELVTSFKPLKWLTVNAEFNIYKYKQQGFAESVNLDFSDSNWYTTWTLRAKPSDGLTIQGRFYYEGPYDDAQVKNESIFYLNLGASKNLFKNSSTLIFNVNNIFNTNKLRGTVEGEDFIINQVQNFNAARWTLSFVYKFNKKTGEREKRANRSNRY